MSDVVQQIPTMFVVVAVRPMGNHFLPFFLPNRSFPTLQQLHTTTDKTNMPAFSPGVPDSFVSIIDSPHSTSLKIGKRTRKLMRIILANQVEGLKSPNN